MSQQLPRTGEVSEYKFNTFSFKFVYMLKPSNINIWTSFKS